MCSIKLSLRRDHTWRISPSVFLVRTELRAVLTGKTSDDIFHLRDITKLNIFSLWRISTASVMSLWRATWPGGREQPSRTTMSENIRLPTRRINGHMGGLTYLSSLSVIHCMISAISIALECRAKGQEPRYNIAHAVASNDWNHTPWIHSWNWCITPCIPM